MVVRERMKRRVRFGGLLVVACVVSAALAADDVVISEFLATNADGLRDEDGDASDWLELGNVGTAPVELTGWTVSDDPARLDKWALPELVLEPGDFLVIFASGKDRSDPAGELHTNFRLSANGEFLALVTPAGEISQSFAPEFPPQNEDVSYGLESLLSVLIESDGPGAWWVPQDDRLGREWTLPGFDDSPWAGVQGADVARVPLGYSAADLEEPTNFYAAAIAATPGLRAYWRLGETDGMGASEETGNHGGRYVGDVGRGAPGALVGDDDAAADFRQGAVVVPYHGDLVAEGAPWSIEAWVQPEVIDSPFAVIAGRKASSTGVDYLLEVFRRDRFRYLAQANFVTARVEEPFAGDRWFHLVAVQDPLGAMDKRFYLDGVLVGGSAWRPVAAPVAGETPLEIGGRVDANEWFVGRLDEVAVYGRALADEEIAEHHRMALEPDGFASLLATDVDISLRGVDGSLYLRLPFEVADPLLFTKLTLRMRYQHGFVAYLNGREVARRNAPDGSAWNATAPSARASAQVLAEESIDVSDALEVLRAGRNVLAVQGLKASANSPSFLLAPRLEAETVREPVFFVEPSPGLANRSGAIGLLGAVRASVPRGFQDTPVHVVLETADEGVTIRYTLDGSPPSDAVGVDYGGPVLIEATTVLRAAAFRKRYETGPVTAWTYIFAEDVLRQTGEAFPERWGGAVADYAMDSRVTEDPRYRDTLVDDLRSIPVLSVSLAPEELFGARGLYSNPEARGRATERRAGVEFFEADGEREFHVEAGLRMHGGSSRRADITPQHSLRLHFRGEYDAPQLEFPLFSGSDVDRFDTLVISANSSDNWTSVNVATGAVGQFIRDQWARDVQRDMGHSYVAGTYVHLFLDGLYWGLYNLTERVDEGLAAEHFGGSKEDYDVVVDGAATHGEVTEWRRLLASGRARDWAAVESLLAVDNFIDYLLINMFTGNWDWPDHNWNAIRRRAPEGRFRFLIWDSEVGLGLDVNVPGPIAPRQFHVNLTGARADLGAGNIAGGPGELYNLLRVLPEFRLRFSGRLHLHLRDDGVLTADRAAALYEARAMEIEAALAVEAARWGDVRRDPPDVPDGLWSEERRWIVDEFLPLRPAIVLEQFRRHGLYDGSEEGGRQLPGDLSQDGSVQLDDVVVLLELIFRDGTLEALCPRVSDATRVVDVSGDGRVNLVDVIQLLTFVLGRGPAPHGGAECLPMAGCREACSGE